MLVEREKNVIKHHSNGVTAASFSPNGKNIVTASFDKTAVLWELNGKLITTFNDHTNDINQAEFSENGQYILTGSEDATAKLWNIDGTLIKTFGENNSVEYTSATFSKDGKFAIVSSKNNSINFWVLPKGINDNN
jgi:WD40 repeat protein